MPTAFDASRRKAVGVAKIYALRCPVSGAFRYIGKTVLGLEQRLAGHMRGARRGSTKYHHGNWLRSLIATGERPTAHRLFLVPELMRWQDAERFFIAAARSFGMSLTNATSGGEGLRFTDPEAIENVSASLRAAWQRQDIREKRLRGMTAARANPEVRKRWEEGVSTSAHRHAVAVALATSNPAYRAAASARFREVWAREGMLERKASASRDVWKRSSPEHIAARRAAMSAGKKASWARKRLEAIRSHMEWDTI